MFIVCLFSYNGCDLVAASGRPADLSKKQAPRAQLIGKQVVCENDPRTRATAKCDWLSLTAPPVATGEAKIGGGMKSCDSAAASGRPADLSKKQAQRAQLIG